MSFVNFASTMIVEKMLVQMQKHSKEVLAAASGPALANAALLLADGCPDKYVANLRVLYQANDLPCPDMDVVFDLQGPSTVSQATTAMCQTTVAMSKTTSAMCQATTALSQATNSMSQTDNIQSKLVDTRDTAAQTSIVLAHKSSFDVPFEEEKPVMDLSKIPDIVTTQDFLITHEMPASPDMDEYSESQQLGDILRAMASGEKLLSVSRSRFLGSTASSADIYDVIDSVEEIPATIDEIEGILNAFDTIRNISSAVTGLEDNSMVSHCSSFKGVDLERTAFKSGFYTLTNFENLGNNSSYDDWFESGNGYTTDSSGGSMSGLATSGSLDDDVFTSSTEEVIASTPLILTSTKAPFYIPRVQPIAEEQVTASTSMAPMNLTKTLSKPAIRYRTSRPPTPTNNKLTFADLGTRPVKSSKLYSATTTFGTSLSRRTSSTSRFSATTTLGTSSFSRKRSDPSSDHLQHTFSPSTPPASGRLLSLRARPELQYMFAESSRFAFENQIMNR